MPSSSPPSVAQTLTTLQTLQSSHPLSILHLASPLIPDPSPSASSSSLPTPTALLADLTHYRDLFSKLRFSYLEQVTKEKFLRAIVGDPPLIVEAAENTALETDLSVVKAELKRQKQDVAALVTELEARGREVCRRYATVQLQTSRLETLPGDIEGLRAGIEALKAAGAETDGGGPEMRMPLGATVAVLEERERESQEVEREIERLEGATVPRRTRELERLEGEIGPLRARAEVVGKAAAEARRRREVQFGEGGEDELEVRGRWYRGVEGGVRGMLGVEG